MSATKRQFVNIFKVGNPNDNMEKAKNQLNRLSMKVLGKALQNAGWSLVGTIINGPSDRITAKLTFSRKLQRDRADGDEVFTRKFLDQIPKLAMVCREFEWEIDPKSNENLTEDIMDKGQNFDFEIPSDIAPYFAHIFDRDAQARLIYSSIMAAKASQFKVRNHCLLYGKPACGKTETLLAFEKILGAENVLKLDATSTSKAGAENLLLEHDSIPPVIILEEAEKCNPTNLPWLLGIMDDRGEIIKTNARVGNVRKEAKCLILATVNNLHEFEGVMSGALASRFQHKIYFPRPSEAVLLKILQREVKAVNGNEAWIPPILDYLQNVENNNDPRRAKALLDGRDKWLTGEYLSDLNTIRNAMKADGIMK